MTICRMTAKEKSPSPATGTSGHEYALYPVIQLHIASAFARQVAESDKYYERLKCGSIMDKVEIILRTTTSSGKVTEQLLTEFNIRQPASEAGIILQFSGLSIDPIQYQISYQGKLLQMTMYEFQVLAYLAYDPGKVFTKEQIYQNVWKQEPADTDNAVCCIISSIRRKLRKVTTKEYIQTVWGTGYKFVDIPGE